MDNKVRTRFAPSPTGYMHVGNLRTALYAYLITKKSNGDFILRIEDTDQERYVDGAVDIIYNTLRETGLNWDEGPDVGGEYGPYIQSERRPLYKEYAEKLCEKGGAYYCFCSKERLESLHAEGGVAARYDGHCRDIPLDEARKRAAAGEPYVIRQKMPRNGETAFDDAVYGHISIDNDELEDQVLLKSDGLPTYNFANVIDDHLMGITHVVRGSEYLSSTPKYNLLYNAFGWQPPVYIHCPPVMKDAQNKLSKRNGDASYQDLIAKGYLTGAVLNYIALLGWSPRGEREVFSLPELVEAFDISSISKSPAIFDPEKLLWLNAEYVRALSLEQFHDIALPFIKQSVGEYPTDTMLIAGCLHQRTEKLSDIPPQLDFITQPGEYSDELFINKKSKSTVESSVEMLTNAIPALDSLSEWTQESIHDCLVSLAEQLGVKNGLLMWPVRIGVSGKTVTPGGAVEVLGMVGREQSLIRLNNTLEALKHSVASKG